MLVSSIAQSSFAVAFAAPAPAASVSVTAYLIELAPLSTGVFATVATTTSTGATVGSLAAGTTYTIRVSALLSGGAFVLSPASLALGVTTATATTAGGAQYPSPAVAGAAAPAVASIATGAVTLAWADLFKPVGGYAISSYELQVAYDGAAFATVYSGAATAFTYTATQNLTAATLTARVRALSAATATASAFVALPIATSAPSVCLNGGVPTGDGRCQCAPAYLGPDCAIAGGIVTRLAPALTLTSKVVDAVIHLRLETRAPAGPDRWFGIAVGVTGGDGMSGGDFMMVSTDGGGGMWTVSDRYASAQAAPALDASQDLANAVVWASAGGGRVATFSRLLVTRDTQQDKPIVAGLVPVRYNISVEDAERNSACKQADIFHNSTYCLLHDSISLFLSEQEK